jgi:hypothetical protein
MVIALVLLTHSYTDTGFIIGALLLAMAVWCIARIRPASAYSDQHHRTSLLAAEFE